eukprot:12154920-Alexandrium_andersonii.AAC.1
MVARGPTPAGSPLLTLFAERSQGVWPACGEPWLPPGPGGPRGLQRRVAGCPVRHMPELAPGPGQHLPARPRGPPGRTPVPARVRRRPQRWPDDHVRRGVAGLPAWPRLRRGR